MTTIQCPVCKNDFEIELDISIKTKGLTVFRGKMGFLGKLEDVNALLKQFRQMQKMMKQLKSGRGRSGGLASLLGGFGN